MNIFGQWKLTFSSWLSQHVSMMWQNHWQKKSEYHKIRELMNRLYVTYVNPISPMQSHTVRSTESVSAWYKAYDKPHWSVYTRPSSFPLHLDNIQHIGLVVILVGNVYNISTQQPRVMIHTDWAKGCELQNKRTWAQVLIQPIALALTGTQNNSSGSQYLLRLLKTLPSENRALLNI